MVLVRNFAHQHRLPGIATGVWRRGEVVLRMGVGNQDGPGSPPIDGETVFHLASVTKPFVATAVMQLVAEDKMCLDCPLRHYLPYFSMQGPGADRITIRQVLTHTAGMGDTSDFGWTTPEYDDAAVERYVRSLASVRLDFLPGSDWRYSNRGCDVLADAIAKADGEPFETVIQRRILTPLGAPEHVVDERYRLRPDGSWSPSRWERCWLLSLQSPPRRELHPTLYPR